MTKYFSNRINSGPFFVVLVFSLMLILTLPIDFSYSATDADIAELWKQVKWSPNRDKSWVELKKPITEGPRHPKYPWLPAEEFPFTEPFTGEEIAFRSAETYFFGTYDISFVSRRTNKRGHMIERYAVAKYQKTADYKDVIYPDRGLKPGECWFRILQIYETPPETRAQGFLVKIYKEDPENVHHPDYWMYLPAIKRLRRMGSGDKEDDVTGADISWDDLYMRQAWDDTHKLIGTDCIFEGETMYENTLGRPEIWANHTSPYKKHGDSYYYECYVIESKSKDPKYYLSRRLAWVEKETFLKIREEQYDRKGDLFRIYDWHLYAKIPSEGSPTSKESREQGGYMLAHLGFTVPLDHRTGVEVDEADVDYGWTLRTPDNGNVWYNPQQMTKERFWKPRSRIPSIKSASELRPMPPLFLDKFPTYRNFKWPKGSGRWLREDDKKRLGIK